jgi:hypothetical protein
MGISFTLQDNSSALIAALNAQLTTAAELIGMKATNYTAALTPVGTPESTGVEGYSGSRLRNSMTYRVVSIQHGRTITVGSALFYAPYVELGTGIYASNGNGRKSPWVWIDKNGKGHWTRGIKPVHMLKRGIEEHLTEYKDILEQSLKF